MNYFKIAVYQNGLVESELESIFDAKAAQSFKKGEKTVSAFMWEQDSWMFQHDIADGEDMDTALGEFLQKHLKKSEKIAELSNRGEVSLTVAVYPEEDQVDIDISPENLTLLGNARVGLHIEAVYLNSGDDI